MLAALCLAATPATADDWSAARLSGAVLSLAGSAWSEVEKGAIFSRYGALRTLQGGRLTLVTGGAIVVIGPNTTLELLTEPDGSGTLFRQYSGTLTIESDASVGDIRLETASLLIAPSGGSVTVTVTGIATEVAVRGGGSASVTNVATGATTTVPSGHALTSAPSDNAIAAVDPGQGEVSSFPVQDSEGPSESTQNENNGGAGGNASGDNNPSGGNAGGNSGSNGGGNSNSGGNGGGNGNAGGGGNASGSGNGNAGGNSNASSNAGANGNAGGNSNDGGPQ